MSSVLVIDVGGTNTRLALAQGEQGQAQLGETMVVATPKGNLHQVIQSFMRQHPNTVLDGLAVAAAGRIRRLPGRTWVSLTNASLSIEREDLQSTHSLDNVWLVNDLAAIAAALPWLDSKTLLALGAARSMVPGHRLVVGVGTGLGAAALAANGTLLETEAGHASLASVSASERRWLDSLAPLGRVSAEQVLSGPGLLRLYQAVTHQAVNTHEELLQRWDSGEPGAVRTLLAFSTWLGRAVGDLVLGHGAWGGVVLAGGVVERLGERLDATAFRSGFEDKSPFAADMASVPTWTVHHPQPALLGLARLALS